MALKDIRLIRDITVYIDGVTHQLKAGWQKVEQEVADHWFVKGNTDTNNSDSVPDTRDAQIVELAGQNSMLTERAINAEKAAAAALTNETKVAELTADLAAMTSVRDNLLSDKHDLEAKVADLQATIDLSAPPASDPAPAADVKATAPTGGKAKA